MVKGSSPTVVYIIEAVGLDRIKIGFTKDLKKRLKAIGNGSPAPLEILTTIPGGVDLKCKLHEMFIQHRMNGEWFRAPVIRRWVQAGCAIPENHSPIGHTMGSPVEDGCIPGPGVHNWIKLVIATDLPLPGDVRGIRSISGTYLPEMPISGDEGLYIISCSQGAYAMYPTYSLFRCTPIFCEELDWGANHKKLIKNSGLGGDLIPGAGPISAMVREIHALERGILTLHQVRTIRAKGTRFSKIKVPSAGHVSKYKHHPQDSQDNLSSKETFESAQYREHVRCQYLLGDGWTPDASKG
jgi:hypothetical protein